MKSLLAASFIGLTALTQSALATSILIPQRDTRVISYDVPAAGAKMSSQHIKSFAGGFAEVNYFENTVRLVLEDKKKCPVGLFCTQEATGLYVELPIIKKELGGCGIVIVTATHDMRPVDGILQQIKIEDFSNATCKYAVKYIGLASYVTSYFDRIKGKTATYKSSFKVDMKNVQTARPPLFEESFSLINGELTRGFAKGEVPDYGTLTVGQDTVTLVVQNTKPCPINALCKNPRIESSQIEVISLSIVHRQQTRCGERIVAQGVYQKGNDLQVQLKIENFVKGICELYPLVPVVVKYELIDPTAFFPVETATLHFEENKLMNKY